MTESNNLAKKKEYTRKRSQIHSYLRKVELLMLSTQTMKLYAKMTKLSHTLEGFSVEVGQHYQKQECLFPAYLKTLQRRGAKNGPLGQ
jgi:hypothetical protein